MAVAIVDAQYKVFDLPPDARSSSMGMGMPATVVVPEPPVAVLVAILFRDVRPAVEAESELEPAGVPDPAS